MKSNLCDKLSGDGVCHDLQNNELCNFDMGDCCLVPINTEDCIECKCRTPDTISDNASG